MAGLNLTARRVKYLLELGVFPHTRLTPTGQRLMTPANLQAAANELGLTIDWEAIINTD